MEYDAFICYASEDKHAFVAPLARELVRRGARIWFDEFRLQVGDGLRKNIESGLRSSRYGIVILSPSFFSKSWPQREFDALLAAEMRLGDKVILPLRHGVAIDEIGSAMPLLADRVCLDTSIGVERVADILTPILRGHELLAVQNGAVHAFGRIGRKFIDISAPFAGYFLPYEWGTSVDSYVNDFSYDQDQWTASQKPSHPEIPRFVKPGDAVRSGTSVYELLAHGAGFCNPVFIEAFTEGIFDRFLVNDWDEVEYGTPIARILAPSADEN